METVNWLVIDLNSYFASVEQTLNPRLRGKPVAVVPMLADSTSVIAASYEAKKFGVKTGTRVGDAKKMCPGIVLIAGRHEHYGEYHDRIAEALENCHPISSVMSIDEFAFRLRGRDQKIENAVALGKMMKEAIRKVGDALGSSVGLAPNRFLAKLASDMQKPDGLTVILKEDLPQRLYSLKLQDFPGIGYNMLARLNQKGILTVEQMYAQDKNSMRAVWGGVVGERYYDWIRGEDFDMEIMRKKSISHSHVLPPDLRSNKGAYAVAQKLLQKAAYRLRKSDMWTRHIALSMRFMDGTRFEKGVKLLECQDPLTMQEILKTLWPSQLRSAPLKVSLWLTDLIADEDRSLSFFEDERRQNLGKAMDRLNGKYGKNTLYFASLQDMKNAAPTRIAFTNIPDFDDDM